MTKNFKKGISLLVLIITIIVILILSTTVILSLMMNSPIQSANKGVFLNDLSAFKHELELYKSNEFLISKGNYNLEKLQANDISVTYDDQIDTSKNITDLIPSLNKSKNYAGEFVVIDGKLIYQGSNKNMQDWAREEGTEVVIVGEPIVVITNPVPNLVKQGTDVIYTVRFTSNAPLSSINLTDKVELVTDSGELVNPQPEIIIGNVTGTSADSTREVEITVNTDSLLNGAYKLKVKSGVVTNSNDLTNSSDTIALLSFDVDNNPPEDPDISVTPTEWTSGNVTVYITYSSKTSTKLYSYDSQNWLTYTTPLILSDNTVIYAKGLNILGSESGLATLTITNIDEVPPSITVTTANKTSSSVTINAVATDSDSGVKEGTYQYSKDDGATWTAATNQISYTFSNLQTGNYNFKARVSDNAENIGTSVNYNDTTEALGEITLTSSVTSWTNQNVTVTASYPTGIVTKQYSLNGTTWQSYIDPVIITENTTIYAKGLDSAQNETLVATLTITNIDKVSPTVSFGTNGGNNPITVSTTATATDLGIGVNTTQYVWDAQNINAPSSGWTTFTNGSNLTKSGEGTYYLWIKAVDKLGNTNTICSNKFIVGEVEEIVSEVSEYNKIFSGTQTGYSYNNPVIPAGFVAVNTAEAKWTALSTNWNNGLVIQDTSGNQFVWVPIDGSNVKFEKWCTTNLSYLQTPDDTQPSGYNVSNVTTKYKGFYIARFESSNGGNNTVNSKKNKTVWNNINYINSKTYSEQMASKHGYNTSLVGTMLVNGTQWDSTLKWIQNSGKSVTNSISWGNFSNSVSPANVSGFKSLQATGFSYYWRAKNIYDIAGNVREWTSEKYSSFFVYRDGSYSNHGSVNPAACRDYSSIQIADYLGFRVSLYIF